MTDIRDRDSLMRMLRKPDIADHAMICEMAPGLPPVAIILEAPGGAMVIAAELDDEGSPTASIVAFEYAGPGETVPVDPTIHLIAAEEPIDDGDLG